MELVRLDNGNAQWPDWVVNAACEAYFFGSPSLPEALDSLRFAAASSSAPRGGHKDVAELLLAHGAEVTARDSRGKTPLSYAPEFNKDLAELLCQNGGHE